jgi:Flagellar protein YcgR/PilZ domain
MVTTQPSANDHASPCHGAPAIHVQAQFSVDLPIQIDFDQGGEPQRTKTKVLGWSESEYLIVASPTINGRRVMHQQGKKVVVRYVLRGTVFGFASHVVAVTQSPTHLWMLEIPDRAESRNLRRSERINTYLFADTNTGERLKVFNLSEVGALLMGDRLVRAGEPVKLNFTLPNGARVENMSAIVRRAEPGAHGIGLGVEFTDDEKPQRRVIGEFVEAFLAVHGDD